MKIFYKGKLVSSYGKGKKMEAQTKKDNKILIAKYKFDKSIYDNLMPEFNAEFTNYEIVDEYLDTEDIVTTNTETIMIMSYDAEPDEYGILTTEHEVEHISTFSAENIVTRSIYSDELPTLMRFGHLWVNEETDKAKANRAASLISISYLNTDNLTNALGMFRQCVNLIAINCDFNTSNVINMGAMFQHCYKLTTIYLSNFNTSKVNNMNSMFYQCWNLKTIDVSNFNTTNVIDMNYMFYSCNQLTSLDVSNWVTSNVTRMDCMFYNCRLLTTLDVSNFDTSNVTTMEMMFRDCNNLTSIDLSNFDTTNTTDMDGLFYSCDNLTNINISNWDLNNITDFTEVFYETSYLRSITMQNSDYNSVNKIITELPTKTTDSIGTLDITGIDDISQVNIGAAESKYWNILNEEKLYFILGKSKLGQAKLN